MKIPNCIFIFVTGLLLLACHPAKTPVDYVNPYMGNISILLVPTYPTVQLPNSMVRVYPKRADYTGTRISGLPVITTMHRESSAFNILVFGSSRNVKTSGVSYSYDNERITPYSYSVYIDGEDVTADYAPSHQSAVYSFGFSGNGSPAIVLSTSNGAMTGKENSVAGYERIREYPTNVYAYFETSVDPVSSETVPSGKGESIVLTFPEGTENVLLRYGVSFIDQDQAKANLYREMEGFDLQKTMSYGRDLWNRTLGQIEVSGADEDALTVFYTSLYRTYERMINMNEDGRYYSPFDGKVHESEGFDFYNDDWIWDTYRAVHPLRIILEPEKESDMLNSYIAMAEQMDEFWMPTFPEMVGDTRRMNCNHAVASFADACAKGLTGFDLGKAYAAAKNAITEKTLVPWSDEKAGALDRFYRENGYFPALRPGEEETDPRVDPGWEKRQPVAVTLGTAYDEWCLAQIADHLGLADDYEYFIGHSYNYRNIYNPETGFFHPKDSEGNFIYPMDYTMLGDRTARDYYGENNGWIFRWEVQHNIADLVALMGGPKAFISELEEMFATPLGVPKFRFYAKIPDQTGIVGQFSMGNEPSLHVPYLYSYAGAPWLTQKMVRQLVDTWFRNDLMGVCGDEDGGGMSAFVVFSQLGFYPVTPGLPVYVIGSPVFENAKIHLDNGKVFEIRCHNYSPENKYIHKAVFNGREWNKCWFSHDDLTGGGVLEFTMGKTPDKQWGAASVPPSFEYR